MISYFVKKVLLNACPIMMPVPHCDPTAPNIVQIPACLISKDGLLRCVGLKALILKGHLLTTLVKNLTSL
jgi:hypothetical protein